MNKSESTASLTKAIIKVMVETKGIDKSLTVGTGAASYKGVADKDVKKTIGESMARNGLVCVPININESTQVFRWDEMDTYKNAMKQKQSVFTEVKTDYLLMHESGEYIIIQGYGIGIDNGDKSAGKATTYALKNALLYTFLVPTGAIDDTDQTHSDDLAIPKSKPMPKSNLETTPEFNEAMDYVETCDSTGRLKDIWETYKPYQTNDTFKAAVNKKKAELKKILQ